jgi:hypothetical protein
VDPFSLYSARVALAMVLNKYIDAKVNFNLLIYTIALF